MEGKFGSEHNRSKSVSLISPEGDSLVFGSGIEVERELGIKHSAISKARSSGLPHTFRSGLIAVTVRLY